jgi:hypothetical protein
VKLPESYRDIARTARKEGWTITRARRSQHLHWRSPSGRLVVTPSTPSSSQSRYHALAELRRAGLQA